MKKFNNRSNKCYNIENKIVWESRSVALVGVVMVKLKDIGETYILLSKRGKGSADFHGLWNLPCGYLDWDETGYEGICREVYEETGFHIPDNLAYPHFNLWLNNPFYVNTNIAENRQNVSLSYGVLFEMDKLPELTTEFAEKDEVEEAKWVNTLELDKYQFAFNHNKRIEHFLYIILPNSYKSYEQKYE